MYCNWAFTTRVYSRPSDVTFRLEKRRLRRLEPCVTVRYSPSTLVLQAQAFRDVVKRKTGSGVVRRSGFKFEVPAESHVDFEA